MLFLSNELLVYKGGVYRDTGEGIASEDENYTRNEWRWELHSKRVKMKTTPETSEYVNYTLNEWRWKLHSKRVKLRTTPETSEDENYTRN